MVAEIITVGSEILIGDILNTNSRYLCRRLAELGVDVFMSISVGDNENRIKEALSLALIRSDIVILTGGLGPTQDDITKEAVADVVDKNLVEDIKIKNKIKTTFKDIYEDIPKNNYKQSMVIEDAEVFLNENGVAPAMLLKHKENIIILLPGPPKELIPLFEKNIAPYLSRFTKSKIFSKNVNIFGIGESKVDELISDILMGENPTVGIYAEKEQVRLRVTAKAENIKICEDMVNGVIYKIKDRLKEYVYGVDVLNMQSALVEAFKLKNKTFAVAESCTGGLICSSVVEISGCSDCFKTGIVCYCNESKQKILGVDKALLNLYGAVSFQVAKSMAERVRIISKTDFGISTTGIAGPEGGSKTKPVGLVYVGISTKSETKVYKLLLSRKEKNERNKIRYMASLFAMNKARQEVLKI